MADTTSFSRRGFTKILGAGAAYAALRPSLGLAASSARAIDTAKKSSGVIRLSSNENPYGPSPASLKAMTAAFGLAWRYPDEHADLLAEDLAKLHGVGIDHILPGDGSGEILKLCAATFTSSQKKIIIANPTFEAVARHASMARAEVVKIDLTRDYSHDLPRMLAAAATAGLVYICNPNNPTASITPRNDLRAFLAQLPRQTTVLVDEAYHHYVESSDYESVIPLVKDYSNLIVARTFSKIYGMAGLRCGYAVTQPENIKLLQAQQIFDSVNIMALVAARAGLQDREHVAQGRRRNSQVKRYVCAQLDRLGYRYIPSQANFIMIDLRREVKPLIKAMADQNVEVGRFFPALPNFMRVTIGTRPQMEGFISMFRKVMS
jgi:histidinol-phosphate aminotransferase